MDWVPPHLRPLLDSTIAAARADARIIGLIGVGSIATGPMDEFSDLDFVVVCRDEFHRDMLSEALAFAAGLGPLLTTFTGEHVREPRLLLCLYGPPPIRVDLKFIADRDLDHRIEDGRILWQRDGSLDAALQRTAAVWPLPTPQWMEDRFWTWVYNGTTKLGRGELFACLEEIAFLRRVVLGPIIAQRHGFQSNGVRRLEQIAPDLVPALAATVGDHTPRGCAAALRAAVALYQRLRAENADIIPRTAAESATLAYLESIESRLADSNSRP